MAPRSTSFSSSDQLSYAGMSKSLDCLPSPDGVITYMGRSYDVKDVFPSSSSRASFHGGSCSNNRDLLEDDSDEDIDPLDARCMPEPTPPPPPPRAQSNSPYASGRKNTVSHVQRRSRRQARRTKSMGGSQVPLSPIRRPMPRAKTMGMSPSMNSLDQAKDKAALAAPSFTRSNTSQTPLPKNPSRSRSGSSLNHKKKPTQYDAPRRNFSFSSMSMPLPPMGGLTRSKSLGESVRNALTGSNHGSNHGPQSNGGYGIHTDSMRQFEYTKADVTNIIDDQQEFERLKATLKKKGAITNEVLKQRIHFYVKAKKDRDAGLIPQPKQRRSHKPTSLRRSRSDEAEAAARARANTSPKRASAGAELQRRGTFDGCPRVDENR